MTAATLFVVYDAVRTFDDAKVHLQLVAHALAGELALSHPSLDVLQHRVAAYYPSVELGARPSANGALPAIGDDPLSASIDAGDLGPLTLRYDRGALVGSVARTGALTFGAAFAAIAMAFRRRRTERSRAASERQRVQDLVATVPFGMALWTQTGELVVCNDPYLARLNDEDGEIGPGQSYAEAVRGLTRNGHVKLVSDGDANRTLELHREDGSCLLIDERPLGSGGFVTLVTDISDRKRADLLLNSIQVEQRLLARRYHEEKLKAEAASHAKTSFLAHLSHDIRTPLNHIIGFAELIGHQHFGPLGDTRYLGYVEMIKSSGEKLLSSFATILELAELEGGNTVLREEELVVDELMAAVARRFSARAARAGLTLMKGAPCGALLFGDRFCLERMLGNLVDNAVRFTPSGGMITLASYAAEDGVVLEVSDTGIGMTEEQLARLSQPFALGDAAFTREHDGAGLGVAIARAIVELSGGRLAIDSRSTLGTTVAVSLPMRGGLGTVSRAA